MKTNSDRGNGSLRSSVPSAAVQEGEHPHNSLRALQSFGQAVWLDYLRRSLFTSGEFQRLIDEDGLRGVTSNPSIFEKAMAGSTDYLDALKKIERRRDLDPMALYEALAIQDIRDAADLLRPSYDATGRADGYVSLEVSPYLAHDTAGTVADAHRLWSAVDRENIMIKVPATVEGIPAIRQLISDGINVNITLLFGVRRYEEVAQAFLDGLSTFVEHGGDAARIGSVASFFVSRIDTLIDGMLTKRLTSATGAERDTLNGLMGQVAIANARIAYQHYLDVCRSATWQRLQAEGAHPQRLLWASTSTKNPNYSDVRYVEELIGRDTVNTLTPATIEAFREHGRPRASLEEHVEDARHTLSALDHAGISLDQATDRLLEDGVRQFSESFDRLLAAVDQGRRGELKSSLDRQRYQLPPDLDATVRETMAEWQRSGKVRRLWARDATLWTGHDENRWLGWLDVDCDELVDVDVLTRFVQEAIDDGFTDAVLLGMGGSSLCPDVLRKTFGSRPGFLELRVLDSTDPAQIASVGSAVDLERTLFIVSSKSGTTLEPNILLQYFLDGVKRAVGAEQAGSHFVAITDPGSSLHRLAEHERFRRVFFGDPEIGGRYSALSNFGMVPAALMGIDVARLLNRAGLMVHSCAASVPATENPAVALGVILGTLAGAGRNKVTFVTSPPISHLGAWLEQLIAESTGKHGKGLIPIDREALGSPGVYGADRLFVYLRLDAGFDAAQDSAVDVLERAGQPVVRIAIAGLEDIGQEFFRWEFATAVAGSVMGLNPFDQPDVEASKVATRDLTTSFDKTGRLPADAPIFEGSGVQLFADSKNAVALRDALDDDHSIAGYLRAHLARIQPGDYFALLAYLAMTEEHEAALQAMRLAVRDRTHVATCLGFGPRFLHSTGQAYKGGPNTGIFLQVTCDDEADIPVPGQKYSFGIVKAAEARGDFAVLAERDRRLLRVHLGTNVLAGLHTLGTAVTAALRDERADRTDRTDRTDRKDAPGR